MSSKSFETVLMYFLFVFNMAGIGFLIAIIINAILFYINSPSATWYSMLIKTKLFVPQYFLDYFLTAVLFAVLAVLSIYVWKQKRSIKKMVFN